jgi:hypothetical protein
MYRISFSVKSVSAVLFVHLTHFPAKTPSGVFGRYQTWLDKSGFGLARPVPAATRHFCGFVAWRLNELNLFAVHQRTPPISWGAAPDPGARI